MMTSPKLISAFGLVLVAALTRAQQLRVTFGLPGEKQASVLVLPHKGHEDSFFVTIQNISKHSLSIIQDGNSWGDRTLSFGLMFGSTYRTAIKSVAAYTKNVLELVHLKPCETTVRKVYYDSDGNGAWIRFPDGSRELKGTIGAIFHEEGKGLNIKGLWSGTVSSDSIPVIFHHK